MAEQPLHSNSAGLGLRRELPPELQDGLQAGDVDFFELAPENWIGVGGRFATRFREFSQRYPLTLHGLSLIGGWPGALIAQQVLRHKSRKEEFRFVFWLTVVINVGVFTAEPK